MPPQARRRRGRPSSRETMLDAAQAVVLEDGAARLTLDAVAKRAAVSKGGVLYNFPSKAALLEAMIERLISRNVSAHAAITAKLPDRRGRSLRAYVMNSARALDADDRVSAALLAAVANDPGLLEPAARYFAQRFASISGDLPFERAALVHLATEGLWMLELLQLSPFTPAQRARIVRRLLKLTQPDANP